MHLWRRDESQKGQQEVLNADVRRIVAQLQAALGLSVVCGQITLNINNGDVETVDVRTKVKVPRVVDKRAPVMST